ncbi:MAG TPA: hypothetical protein DD405_05070 [Desulfobacteraceae bacterium]|nr:hypothetical protein [Desulfobacteraceae bacterium]
MELKDRKYTTAKGIKELQQLIDGFDFESDIKTINSADFPLITDIGEDREYLWTETGYFQLENGNLTLQGQADTGYSWEVGEASWVRITRIDFGQAMPALAELIKKYNIATAEKDAQIEKFLAVCESLKK